MQKFKSHHIILNAFQNVNNYKNGCSWAKNGFVKTRADDMDKHYIMYISVKNIH